jgi:hypothetical protein
MVKVPDCIRVNSISKELINVFSKPKAETEKIVLLKTREMHMYRPEKVFDIMEILLIATP